MGRHLGVVSHLPLSIGGGEIDAAHLSEAPYYLSRVDCEANSADIKRLGGLGDAMMTCSGDFRRLDIHVQYIRMAQSSGLVPDI